MCISVVVYEITNLSFLHYLPNFSIKHYHNLHLSHSFCESEIRAQVNWVLCMLHSHLEAWLRKDPHLSSFRLLPEFIFLQLQNSWELDSSNLTTYITEGEGRIERDWERDASSHIPLDLLLRFSWLRKAHTG